MQLRSTLGATVLCALVACGVDALPQSDADPPGGSPPIVDVADPGDAAPPPATPPPPADGAPPPVPTFRFARYDINHILGTGQSLATGAGSIPESLTQPYDNLMLAYGVQAARSFSDPFRPLVEAARETMSSSLANELTELATKSGVEHTALVSVHAAGGTPYSGLKKGTDFYQRGMDQVTGAKTRAALSGKSYVVRAVTSVHGESDSLDGSTTYAADIIQWQADYQADVQAITGQTIPVPMFHTQNTQQAESRIPLDMLAAHVSAHGKVVLVGPKYHLPLLDGVHLTVEGYKHLGEDYAKAYRRVVFEGGTWEPVRPKTITRAGAQITIVFYVPSPPLVFDTTRVTEANHYGFGYVDQTTPTAKPAPVGQAPTIQSVELVAPDTVRITLASVPAVPGRIRYAVDYGSDGGPRGNLRDSDSTHSRYGFDLFNWGVQFEASVPAP